jgi:mannose-6-phosphate isomerase-like protein (cupin superfamily)
LEDTTMNDLGISTAGRVLGPEDGELGPGLGGTMNRFILDAAETRGQFALCEHRLPPGALAAPLHLHTREDEYSFVLEGRVGALLGDTEVFAEAGDLVIKPRNEWHTFWNAGAGQLRILEIIAPGGLEELFRKLPELADAPDPAKLGQLAASFGTQTDFAGTFPIVERHGLKF